MVEYKTLLYFEFKTHYVKQYYCTDVACSKSKLSSYIQQKVNHTRTMLVDDTLISLFTMYGYCISANNFRRYK